MQNKQTKKKLLCILVKCILLIEAKMNVIWAVIGNKERNVERKCPEIKLGHSKKQRATDSRGHIIGNGLKKIFCANFTFQNCEEFYVKETTKCSL